MKTTHDNANTEVWTVIGDEDTESPTFPTRAAALEFAIDECHEGTPHGTSARVTRMDDGSTGVLALDAEGGELFFFAVSRHA